MIRPPLDVQAASRLAPNVRLHDITCIQVEGKHVGVVEPRHEMTLSWDMPNPTAVWYMDGQALRAVFPIRLGIDLIEAELKTRVAEFLVVLRLDYEIKAETEYQEADVPHYVGITGFMHVWPYLRAEIQWLTTKLGMPPLVLPVIVSGHAAKIISVTQAGDTEKGPVKLAETPPRKALKPKPSSHSRISKRAKTQDR